MTIVNLSGDQMIELVVALTVSYLLALPLGWERERDSESHFELQVFPLVSVSCCAYLFLAQRLFTGPTSAEQSDILQGLMTGIGFIGGGAILKERGQAHGVATAAAIWTTGGIGASVAYGYYAVAIGLAVLSLLILEIVPRFARSARSKRVDRT